MLPTTAVDESATYKVTLTYEATVTVTVRGSADAAEEWLTETALQMIDEGDACFETTYAKTDYVMIDDDNDDKGDERYVASHTDVRQDT